MPKPENSAVRATYKGVPFLFRVFLLAGVVLIAFVFIYYTQDVVGKLKSNTVRMAKLSIRLLQAELSNESSGEATGVIFDEIIAPLDVPIIITDAEGNPLFFRNISGLRSEEVTPENSDRLKQTAAQMARSNGRFPIKHIDLTTGSETVINYFYYGEHPLIRQLQTMPFIEIGLVGLFILIAFIGYRNIKRGEQGYIWVGMAKETAHQLGTPISSLLGWLELLRGCAQDRLPEPGAASTSYDVERILHEMHTDINRLQKVANRFSQIGSRPSLKGSDLNELLGELCDYFRQRLPQQGKGLKVEFSPGRISRVNINSELIGWVFENLIKNALEACDPRNGVIKVTSELAPDGKEVRIQVIDNGRGIPPSQQKTIFKPGFTTKARGWGLGLSIARRIVEEYHGGRLSLKSSLPGRETILQVSLPVGGRPVAVSESIDHKPGANAD